MNSSSDKQLIPELELEPVRIPQMPLTPAERVIGGSAVRAVLRKTAIALAGLFVFILALELLRDGARGYGKTVIEFLHVTSSVNALGLGWLMAYLFLSGSPVAAIAITLFSAETINALQAFAMVTGSRLGAAFIVLFIGFVYYLRGHGRENSISIGVLSLLTTWTIYIPAFFIGIWLINSGYLGTMQVSADTPLHSFLDLIYDPIMGQVKALGLPGWAVFFLGIAALLLGFQLLDRALPEMTPESGRFRQASHFIYRPMAMFILGMAVTSITMSVAVSLSILVPLSAKGIVRRENTMPYIMGANITTFIDTLIAALIVGGPAAFVIVLIEMVVVAGLSLAILLFCYAQFERMIMRLQEQIMHNNRTLAVFLGVMLIVPALLLFI